MDINEIIYQNLLTCDWLSNLGTDNNCIYNFKFLSLKSKEEVLENIESIEWENVCLGENNNLSDFLSLNYKEKYDKYWNSEVEIIKIKYLPPILEKIKNILDINEYPEIILDDIRFNIISILMVSFYSEFYQSNFFEKMLEVYLSGHLPCGWSGEYPEGLIKIY